MERRAERTGSEVAPRATGERGRCLTRRESGGRSGKNRGRQALAGMGETEKQQRPQDGKCGAQERGAKRPERKPPVRGVWGAEVRPRLAEEGAPRRERAPKRDAQAERTRGAPAKGARQESGAACPAQRATTDSRAEGESGGRRQATEPQAKEASATPKKRPGARHRGARWSGRE
jgi:hypothetical protein